ncbi:LLM class flavin-dependent oxidoreductase [Pseudooceanicola sp.]|uniref:LLM class flavin-dependent oxidoreductase n=1 Tax=Pseudooceanicola sp. TaxID=1914328 RepID=UPI0035117714
MSGRQDGRPNNPLFGPNRLKIGIFGTNGKGSAHTRVPGHYKPSWDNVLATARTADAAGYEAIVAYARWKGYVEGRPDHPGGIILDPYIFAAGVAQATSHAAVFATSHAPTIHPLLAAKQTATIDHVSNGRLALNVVAGWNKPELEMFGAPLKEHTERYEHLAEWLHVLRRLWTEVDEFDHAGAFFSIKRGMSMPKPLQLPCPPIMCAGSSEVGRRFAGEHADICFVLLQSEDPADWARQIDAYKSFAREEFGREIQVWTYAPVVQRDTLKEAQAYLDYFAVEHEDSESVDAWIAGAAQQSRGLDPEAMRRMRKNIAAGGGGTRLIGTADMITEQLAQLSEAGLDGILFTWVDFIDGLARFNAEILPQLENRGLRQPVRDLTTQTRETA